MHTLTATAHALNAEGRTTATGAPWTVNTVAKVHNPLTTRSYAQAP